MKKQLLALLVFAGFTALSAGMAFASAAPGAGIVGSVHDFRGKSGMGKATAETRVCVFCHTPHHALLSSMTEAGGGTATSPSYLPLWSHSVNAESFTPYYSALYNGVVSQTMRADDVLVGPSRLCMSCHDGVTAVDAYYNNFTAGTAVVDGGPDGNNFLHIAVGRDSGTYSVSRSHPMGFDLKAFIAGPNATGYVSALLDNVYKGNTNGPKVSTRLYDPTGSGTVGYMTCATCHDVHNKLNVPEATVNPYLTLAPQTDSALCLTCHNK